MDHVIVVKDGVRSTKFIAKAFDKGAVTVKLFELHPHKFWMLYRSTDIPVDDAAGDFLAVGAKTIDGDTKNQLTKLAGKKKPRQLDWNMAKGWLRDCSYTDVMGKPVRSVAVDPLSTTGQESIEMATAKKAAAKKPAAKAASKKGATAAPAEKKERKPGVGSLIREGILAGKEDDKILAEIAKKFPESKSGKKDISWYRSKMKRDG